MMNNRLTRHELAVTVELDWAVEGVFSAPAIEASVYAWMDDVLAEDVIVEVLHTGSNPGPSGHPVDRITGRPHNIRAILASYEEESNPS